jgi:outer membrane receptor for ferrienterochelin and colicin
VVYGGEVALPLEMPQPEDFRPLQEETSINSAVSAEFSYGAIGMHRLTYYYNHLNDMIDFTLLGFTPSYWRGVYVYQNVERAYTQGIEWESRVKMRAGTDVSLSYTYLKSRNLKTGDELLNRPAHTAKLLFSAMTADSRWGGTFWLSYESKKLWVSRSNTGEQEGNPEWAPDQTVVSLNTYHRMGDIEAFVRLDNIFDRTNVTYGYWPGRQIFAGVKYDVSIH